MEQEKRNLCPYDDMRYLLADISDGRPNPNTHADGHRDLESEENLVADHPEPIAELVIRHVEERFDRRHARVITHLGLSVNIEEKMINDDNVREPQDDLLTETTRPKGAMRIEEVIERICARQNLDPPVSPPARMPAPPSPQHAGPSVLNADATQFRRRIDPSDEEDEAPERPVCPPLRRFRLNEPYLDKSEGKMQEPTRRRKALRRVKQNPFIDKRRRRRLRQ